jgi:transcriptional regulator with XRE-family HTH domain
MRARRAKKTRSKPSKDDIEIGKRICEQRILKSVSQAELGEVLGVTQQQVNKYEKGFHCVSAARLKQIATMLDTPITYFYEDTADGAKKSARPALTPFALKLLSAVKSVTNKKDQRRILETTRILARTWIKKIAKNSGPAAGDFIYRTDWHIWNLSVSSVQLEDLMRTLFDTLGAIYKIATKGIVWRATMYLLLAVIGGICLAIIQAFKPNVWFSLALIIVCCGPFLYVLSRQDYRRERLFDRWLRSRH